MQMCCVRVMGLLLAMGIAGAFSSRTIIAQSPLKPLADNNDDLFERDGGLKSWIAKRMQQRSQFALSNDHPETFFKNAKIAAGLFEDSGKIAEQWQPYFGYYADGTLGGSGTLKLPRSTKDGKPRPAPGDIVVIPRSGRPAMILVYVGSRSFPAEAGTPRDFFLYPYWKGSELNTFPPRHDWNYWSKKPAAQGKGPNEKPQYWRQDSLSDLAASAALPSTYWLKPQHTKSPFRHSTAWKDKLAYFVVRTRESVGSSDVDVDVPLASHPAARAQVIPVSGTATSSPSARSKQAYENVINGFAVHLSGHARYKKAASGDTYCNIFAWDVSRAMGAELAHWIDAQGNLASAPLQYDSSQNVSIGKTYSKYTGSGYTEVTANYLYATWFPTKGSQYGWRKVSEAEAQARANKGYMTIAVWKNNSGGHGHIAVVRPGTISPSGGPRIAQAGGTNYVDTTVSTGFNNSSRTGIQYWTHD